MPLHQQRQVRNEKEKLKRRDQDKAASALSRCRCLVQPALDALELSLALPEKSSRVTLAALFEC